MRNLLKNRLALSTVVATLIILVISVLLAGVVTYFAINVVSTRVQEESLSLSDAHIWLNPTATPGSPNYSQASLKVINTGGRDVVITKVEIRGQAAAWNSWTSSTSDNQYVVYSVTNQPIGTDMYFQNSMAIPTTDPTSATPPTATLSLLGTGTTNQFTFSYATNNLVLASGNTMLLYIVNPDSITINDIGLTVSITIYTAQAMYYQECNVQAYSASGASGSSNSQGQSINNLHAWYDSSGPASQVAMVLTNNGGTAAAISSISVANQDSSSANLYSSEGQYTVSSSLSYIPTLTDGYVYGSYTLQLASGVGQLPMIDSGATMILYIENPAGISASNVGQSVEIDVSFQGGGSVTGNLLVQTAT